MDFNPPTAADYAWSDAQKALKKNKDLEARVSELEYQVKYLIMRYADDGYRPPFPTQR